MLKNLIYELRSKQYISSKQLCENLNINSKQLKKEVDQLNILGTTNFKVVSKTSKGYKLVSDLPIVDILQLNTMDINISIAEKIELKFLIKSDFIKIDELIEKYYVSYSKAYSELTKLKDSYDIVYVRNQGYRVVINDFKRKVQISEIVTKHVSTIDVRNDIRNIFNQIGYDYEEEIERAIYILNNKMLVIKSRFYVSALIICILEIVDNDIKGESEIEKIFECKLDFESIDYWKNFLNSSKNNVEINLDVLLEKINENFNIKLEYTMDDYNQLNRHLHEITNFQNKEIKVSPDRFMKLTQNFEFKYPLASEISKFVIEFIGLEYDVILPKFESIYLAIHFQKLLSKINEKIKIIIVCEYGYAMSSLIANEILTHFDDIEILSMKSLRDFQANINEYMNSVDIVVTTLEPMKLEGVKVITLLNYETENCIQLIKETKDEIQSMRFKSNVMTTFIYKDKSLKSREEVYSYLKNYCKENKICDEKYFESAIEREEKGNVVQNKVAYVHGDCNYVNQNCVFFLKLPKEIEWMDKKCSYIFIIFVTQRTLSIYNK